MADPSGQQLNRRASTTTTCSPTQTHACRKSLSHGEGSPVAARKTRQQPVTSNDESQEHGTCLYDSASSTPATAQSPSPPQSPCPSPVMTEQEIIYEVYRYILEFMDPGGADISHYYERATRLPPITPESLAELDMPCIINNPKLRHDVNFDRELHFRPNLDGSKGKMKLKTADQYWQALEGELFMYGFAALRKQQAADQEEEAYWERVLRASQRRVRPIFEAVRDILKTLVPDHEQKRVSARLDVDLLMQEIMNGVCDLMDLSNWLARVLKAHCAPMRDELVDAMQNDIRDGALEGKHEKLVNGLRQLLCVLESMKLDVANHQIRHMRPLLIDDTVNFQRRYNGHRISVGKIDVRKCQLWLSDELEHLISRAPEASQPTHLEALTSALLRDLLFNEATPHPQTFYLDTDRLRFLRSDLRSTICHELCREILADLAPAWVSRAELLKAQAALHCTVSAIVGMSGRFSDRIENIAVEIVRILLMLEGRYPPFDGTWLPMVEQKLELAFQPASQAFDKLARGTCDRLLPKLKASVDEHIRLSALDLQDALVPLTPANLPPPPIGFGAVCAPPGPVKQYDPDEDIVRRLTHVICLHWQVWAEMVYLAPTEDDTGLTGPGSAPSSPPASVSASPTIPIAQAVYAPGKKWLPVGVTVMEVPSGMPTPASTPEPMPQPLPKPTRKNSNPDEASTEQESFDDAHRQQPA